ncbi:MAG: hypothetical protein ABIT09_06630 [Croceibacterium sp.]
MARQTIRNLSLNQKLTLAIAGAAGLGAIFVGLAAVWIAADNTDIKSAITELQSVATQAQRQADGLYQQNGVIVDQLSEQRSQTGSLASQAREAGIQTRQFADEIKIAQKQLANSLAAQHLYERQVASLTAQAAQQYRNIAMTVLNLDFPEKPGPTLKSSVRVENTGTVPVSLEDFNTAVAVTDEPLDQFTKAAFGDFAKAPRQLARVSIPPGTGFTKGNTVGSAVTDELIRSMRLAGAKVIVVAEVIYRDALGNLHHQYACSYSTYYDRDQICLTPDAD